MILFIRKARFPEMREQLVHRSFSIRAAFIALALMVPGLCLAQSGVALQPSSSLPTSLSILSIYADEAGESHFRTIVVEMGSFVGGGTISAPVAADSVWFRIAPGDQDTGFHVAPRRQLVITLSGGAAEFETSDGDKRRVDPGEILLVEDTRGKGHRTRTIDGIERRGIFISVPDTK